MNRDIPGFYYDPERKRYFRIERNSTTPTDAAWSASNVKRRKIEAKEAKKVQRRQDRTKGLIKRASVLADPLLGGLLNRELGHVSEDVPASGWARGLREKGELPFTNSHERVSSPNIQHMYIDGSDTKTGLGVALATVDGSTLYSHYIPTDSNDRINFRDDAHIQYQPFHPIWETLTPPEMSCITYHAPTNQLLITSSTAGGWSSFPPVLSSPQDNRPAWLLGEDRAYSWTVLNPPKYRGHRTNACTPGPANARLAFLLGTDEQIVGVNYQNRTELIRPPRVENDARSLDTFSMDFSRQSPDVIFAGGRYSRIWSMDLRAPPREWDWWRPRSAAVAHVKALNEHQVLAAGIRSHMCVYDVRFRSSSTREWTRPVVQFHGYRNAEHLHVGLDVDRAAGVVAAAHDDGSVAVYSLRSGRRLKAGDVDGIAADGPVKAVMFQTMPREKESSLFVGVGPYIKKYSFGITDLDEW